MIFEFLKYSGLILMVIGALCISAAAVVYWVYLGEDYDNGDGQKSALRFIHPRVRAFYDRNYMEGKGKRTSGVILKLLRISFYLILSGCFLNALITLIFQLE